MNTNCAFKKWEEMTLEDRNAAREQRAEKLEAATKKLFAGIEALIASNRWEEYLKFQGRFHRYSFCNTVLILLQCPDATRVASYRTWQKMKRWVRRGETGISIFVPILVKEKFPRQAQEPEPNERSLDEKATQGKAIELQQLVGFKIGYVFDVAQTEGEPLPANPVSLLQSDDARLYQVLRSYAQKKLHVEVLEADEGSLPSYVNGDCAFSNEGKPSCIRIMKSNSALMKTKTLAHEIGHAILHTEIEYRMHTSRSLLELEAESVAFIVLKSLGVDSGEYSFGYLAEWGGGEEAIKAVQASGERIRQAAHQVIEWIEERWEAT